ncbi:MAG: class A beta-lactamase-related serine hydrolase [Acidobacteria bacterium]|nr:class A beta-lactamase-related serine hydrolase [Acidobacteriota bacterium]MCA1617228.1 class A beta-lactamase-related serine hydrolase [Acidobacteriota bacterium]
MKPLARFGVVLALLVLLVSLVPAAAGACPLCRDAKADTDYAGGTASLPNGFYYSILFMVCAPFAVVGGLVTRIVLARRRARAVRDMIRVSSNDATGFVVDSITGTTSGPEITGPEWESWKEKRNAVNRYFEKRGYRDLNANQKTFCEDAYGREQAFRDGGRNRNRMTPDAVARLFAAIARGEIAGPAGTAEMLGLLSREVTSEKPLEDGELEDARLAGHGLPPGTRVWAKSGDAYDVHHLVARIVLPDGGDFVVAVFTKGVKTVPDVIPRVFARVAARFAAPAPARRP